MTASEHRKGSLFLCSLLAAYVATLIVAVVEVLLLRRQFGAFPPPSTIAMSLSLALSTAPVLWLLLLPFVALFSVISRKVEEAIWGRFAWPLSAISRCLFKLGEEIWGRLLLAILVGAIFSGVLHLLFLRLLARVTEEDVRTTLIAGGSGFIFGLALTLSLVLSVALARLRAYALVLFSIALAAFSVILWVTFDRSFPSGAWLCGLCLYFALWLFVVSLMSRAIKGHLSFKALIPSSFGISILALAVAQLSSTGAEKIRAGHGPTANLLTLLTRKVLDFDGDGYSYLLGGGDCDDFDPLRFEAAVDIPQNGVDEDCDGEDATVSKGQITASPYFEPKVEGRRLNVVFVCIDAFRVDHFHFAGYGRQTTPNLDKFAEKAWFFEEAVAPSATTRETVPALLTGRYPSGIKWDKSNEIWQIASDQTTLTTVLRSQGYRTIAIVDEWLDRFMPSFRRGFDHFEVPYGSGNWSKYGQVAAPFITYAAIREVQNTPKGKPFFLYVQYEAPHHPYVHHDLIPDFGNRDIDRYDEEIAYADRYVGILLEYLEYSGLLENTMVVIFSDHGEEFGEHGGFRHSRHVFAESVRVPIIVYIPGEKAKRVPQRVSHVDLLPTVMDVLGLRPEGVEPQGLSLYYFAKGEEAKVLSRPIYSELRVIHEGPEKFRKAIYFGDYKLVWDMSDGTTFLYNVKSDPKEERPVEDGKVKGELLGMLKEFVLQGGHHP